MVVVFLFRSYVRLFNASLGKHVGSRFWVPQQECLFTWAISSIDMTWFTAQFDALKAQLDVINQQLQSQSDSSLSQDSVFQTTAPTKVGLYYFNQLEDQKLPIAQQVNTASLLPVYRVFAPSKNLLVDTITELLAGKLLPLEIRQWFITEFPHSNFRLVSSDLAQDGTLTLAFTEVPGFTDGWSARMLILANSIEKTALQFPEVKKVVFVPETLFQP